MIEWLRADRRPNRDPVAFVIDAAVALVLGSLAVVSLRSASNVAAHGPVEGPWWVVVLAPSALVTVRRLAPAATLAAATGCYLVAAVAVPESNHLLAIVCAPYVVALTRPAAASAVLVGAAAAASSTISLYGPDGVDLLFAGLVVALSLSGWLVGLRVRSHQIGLGRLADDVRVSQRRAEEAHRQAVAEERTRIAGELHDAVGHAVTVMVMHAGATRLGATEERARHGFEEIERLGRTALHDLDRMLGLLRTDDGATLAPSHRIADIGALVAAVCRAGADVTFVDRCGDALDSLDDRPVSVAAYRIVQEALTNAVKHAGPAHVEITVACTGSDLTVAVVDDGRGAAPGAPSRGLGLPSMAERAELLGGTLAAGPRPGGGFAVHAHLPRRVVAP